MSRRKRDLHMHEYDENWKCQCGFRLVTEFDQKTKLLDVKGCVTAEGETVAFAKSGYLNMPKRSAKR